jgi:hypothetical protein
MRPEAVVTDWSLATSLHNTTSPPLPMSVALASMWLSALKFTLVAWCMGPLPCQPPPTQTVPPPVAPLASIRVPLSKISSSLSNSTRPPRLRLLLVRSTALLMISLDGAGCSGALGKAGWPLDWTWTRPPPLTPEASSTASVMCKVCSATTSITPPLAGVSGFSRALYIEGLGVSKATAST